LNSEALFVLELEVSALIESPGGPSERDIANKIKPTNHSCALPLFHHTKNKPKRQFHSIFQSFVTNYTTPLHPVQFVVSETIE
jgi:hypothetical protein